MTLLYRTELALRAAKALETSSLGVCRVTRQAATDAIARLSEEVRRLRYEVAPHHSLKCWQQMTDPAATCKCRPPEEP